jgi:hypothetical protein
MMPSDSGRMRNSRSVFPTGAREDENLTRPLKSSRSIGAEAKKGSWKIESRLSPRHPFTPHALTLPYLQDILNFGAGKPHGFPNLRDR